MIHSLKRVCRIQRVVTDRSAVAVMRGTMAATFYLYPAHAGLPNMACLQSELSTLGRWILTSIVPL